MLKQGDKGLERAVAVSPLRASVNSLKRAEACPLPTTRLEVLDVYPHDENGRRVTIADFLREKLQEF